MQTCTTAQTDNHISTPPLSFFYRPDALPAIHPTVSKHSRPHNVNNAINTHTTVLLLFWNMSRTTQVSRYQKGKTRKVKTSLDLPEQEIVSGSGICWAICKSAPHPRQPHQHPTTQFFIGRMPFLLPNQQRQSTEGTSKDACTE